MHQNAPALVKKRILVAALNWGLGHAARCIPVISELQADGHQVILAADGRAGLLLQKAFPTLTYIELPAYNIRYDSSNMMLNIAWQWPKVLFAALREHQKIRNLVHQHRLDLIISDNRFGCFSTKIKSIFITHQLWIRTPYSFLSFLVNLLNHWIIRRFDECWIPDWQQEPRLAGALSRPIPNHTHRYLGPLSRMCPKSKESTSSNHSIVAILSGPEPQRTRFEQLIIEQAKDLDLPILLIQGKVEIQVVEKKEGKVTIRPFASGKDLNAILLKADLVLCRSGYSSIMDLVMLGSPAILVPTPGQTEQEYLAELYLKRGWFYSQSQDKFDLEKAIKASKQYRLNSNLQKNLTGEEGLKVAIQELNS